MIEPQNRSGYLFSLYSGWKTAARFFLELL